MQPKGIVLSGGPSSVYATDAPLPDSGIFALGVPILGICYGMQLVAHLSNGGVVHPADEREYGSAELVVDLPIPLFANLRGEVNVWMSHGDRIEVLPQGFLQIAHTQNSPIAAMGDIDRDILRFAVSTPRLFTQKTITRFSRTLSLKSVSAAKAGP